VAGVLALDVVEHIFVDLFGVDEEDTESGGGFGVDGVDVGCEGLFEGFEAFKEGFEVFVGYIVVDFDPFLFLDHHLLRGITIIIHGVLLLNLKPIPDKPIPKRHTPRQPVIKHIKNFPSLTFKPLHILKLHSTLKPSRHSQQFIVDGFGETYHVGLVDMRVVLDEVFGVWLVFLKMLDVDKKCFEELV
jgi:hypothetical protein